MPHFRITLPYREPEFERRIGRECDEPFKIVFELEADTPEQAKLAALHEFSRRSKDSLVGWSQRALEEEVVVEELEEVWRRDL